MAQTVSPNDLGSVIATITKEYTDEVRRAVDAAIERTGKQALKEIKVAGSFKNKTGRYRKSWSIQLNKGRLGAEAIIYSGEPGMTTWLEFGHAKQNGGRTAEFPHIADTQKSAEETFEKLLREALE